MWNDVSIEKLFLTQNQALKLKLLPYFKERDITLELLSLQLDISKGKVKTLFDELIIELKDILAGYNITNKLTLDKKRAFFRDTFSEYEVSILLNKLRTEYYLTSVNYQILLLILEYREINVFKISKILNYSESYIYKKLKEIMSCPIFNLFEINLFRQNKVLKLEGDERQIVWMYLFCLERVFDNNYWPFASVSKIKITRFQEYKNYKKYFNLSPNLKNQLNIIYGVYETHIKFGNLFENLDKEIIDIAEINSKNLLKNIKIGKSSNNYIELLYLSFIVRNNIQQFYSEKEKEDMGLKIKKLKNNRLVDSTVSFIDEISNTYYCSDSTKNYLIYYICERIIVLHYLKLYKFVNVSEFNTSDLVSQRFLSDMFSKYYTFLEKEESFEVIKKSILKMVGTKISLMKKVNLKIYIEIIRYPAYRQLLVDMLNESYSNYNITVTDNYSEAQLIITDMYSSDTKKQVFFFGNIFDNENWLELCNFINSIISNHVLNNV